MLRTRCALFAGLSALLAAVGAGCSSQTGVATPPDTRAADEAAIRAYDSTYEQGVAAKDPEKILALYEDSAVLFAPKAPAAVGKAAIRAAWQGLLTVPGVKMTFRSTSVDVSRAGDLAVERGTFQVETIDKDGKPSTETGQAVVAWRKQTDGAWKVTADTNADDK